MIIDLEICVADIAFFKSRFYARYAFPQQKVIFTMIFKESIANYQYEI